MESNDKDQATTSTRTSKPRNTSSKYSTPLTSSNSSKQTTTAKNNSTRATRGSSKKSKHNKTYKSNELIVEDPKEKNSLLGDTSEMTTTRFDNKNEDSKTTQDREQETNIDHNTHDISGSAIENSRLVCTNNKTPGDFSLPPGWEEHMDKDGVYYWHITTGLVQRNKPTLEDQLQIPVKDSLTFYHDDEEINQTNQRFNVLDQECLVDGQMPQLDETNDSTTFVVYPLGCCDFDETQLLSTNNTKAIQKCILRLTNSPSRDENLCWGLQQTEPILMKLLDDHIQFTHLKTDSLLRSQPIQTIKTWAVDDDNNFAFVVEDQYQQQANEYSGINDEYHDSLDYSLLKQPSFKCYVFSSMDDDDMSCKVAGKLNEEINRYKVIMSDRITKCTRVQQMVDSQQNEDEQDESTEIEEIEASNEMTMHVKYIGNTVVPRPVGIDVLNIAIDKCLAETSNNPANVSQDTTFGPRSSPLMDAKLHVSPSSVIVENDCTGEIIVECRIRYLTFMGISRRDIRWCGFIMQNTTNKTFVAHCFECHPSAGHVCDAIQSSCSKMYEKVIKNSKSRQQSDSLSIIPSSSTIRVTLAKTLSRMRLGSIN